MCYPLAALKGTVITSNLRAKVVAKRHLINRSGCGATRPDDLDHRAASREVIRGSKNKLERHLEAARVVGLRAGGDLAKSGLRRVQVDLIGEQQRMIAV